MIDKVPIVIQLNCLLCLCAIYKRLYEKKCYRFQCFLAPEYSYKTNVNLGDLPSCFSISYII